jgi:hypothetical protein
MVSFVRSAGRGLSLAILLTVCTAGPAACKKSVPVGANDCQTWASHAVDVLVSDWRDAASKCSVNIREPVVTRIQGQRATAFKAAVAACGKHVGESVPEEGPRCYMAATTVKGLLDCRLAPMANPDDEELPAQIAQLRANCAQQPPPASSAPPAPSAR